MIDEPCRGLRKDAVRNRQRVLVAARELFASRGLDATLNDVARHANVGVGTVYRRFATKEELVAVRESLIADPDPAARRQKLDVPMVTLATAHPAKFPDAVEQAIGLRPPLPPHMARLMDLPERVTRVENDNAALPGGRCGVVGFSHDQAVLKVPGIACCSACEPLVSATQSSMAPMAVVLKPPST